MLTKRRQSRKVNFDAWVWKFWKWVVKKRGRLYKTSGFGFGSNEILIASNYLTYNDDTWTMPSILMLVKYLWFSLMFSRDTWLTWDRRVIYLRINSDKDWCQSFICEAKKCQLGLRRPSKEVLHIFNISILVISWWLWQRMMMMTMVTTMTMTTAKTTMMTTMIVTNKVGVGIGIGIGRGCRQGF